MRLLVYFRQEDVYIWSFYRNMVVTCIPMAGVGHSGVFTPNKIPLTTIVIFKNVTEAEFQSIGSLYLYAVWYLPFTNSPR